MNKHNTLKKSSAAIIAVLFTAHNLHSQNLVPNGSFESYTTCPVGFSQFNGYVSNWINPSTASPDYYNACANPNPAGVPVNGFGYQQAHTGNAYAGGYMTAGMYREFIQVQLSSSLIAGVAYSFKMYAVLHNKSKWATDDLGVYISAFAPSSAGTGFLNGNPVPQITNPSGNIITDSLNWILIAGTYIASGGEKYITIGHFKPDSLSNYLQVDYGTQGSYYYFDDVSLIPGAPLPVELVSFSATPDKKDIHLGWITASENNCSGFELQRAKDVRVFEDIGWITGNNNSNTIHQYYFNDHDLPGDGIYYYRLMQVDFNGSLKYSSIISASLKNENHFNVTAVLNNSQLVVELPYTGTISLQCINAKSQILKICELHLQKGKCTIDTRQIFKNFSGGIYFVTAIFGDERKTILLIAGDQNPEFYLLLPKIFYKK